MEFIKLLPARPFERIAFFGPMCSGKTYMACQVQDSLGYAKIGFADKLKEVAIDLFDINVKDKNGFTRKLLQEFADDIKKWDKDIFIKHFLLTADTFPRVVCDDLRFVDEANILRANGFTLIKVNCNESIRRERIASLYPSTSESAHTHKSETDYLNIIPDFEIDSNNPSDVKVLYNLFFNQGLMSYGTRY